MTTISFDPTEGLLICDSREVDTSGKVIRDNAIKFAQSNQLVTVVAGNAEMYTSFLQMLTHESFKVATEYFQSIPEEQIAAITISKKAKVHITDLTRALKKPGCNVFYEGAGGDYMRHNHHINGRKMKEAYDKTVEDCYSYSGGNMRYYNFSNGSHNMEETTVLTTSESANDSSKSSGVFMLATPTFDVIKVNKENPDGGISLQELGLV